MAYLYLASPYSHPDPRVVAKRFREVEALTARLLQVRIPVYSPIVHCHELCQKHELPTDAEFWQFYNHTMISSSRGLLVYCIDGWEKSRGVADEMQFADRHFIRTHFIHIDDSFKFETAAACRRLLFRS